MTEQAYIAALKAILAGKTFDEAGWSIGDDEYQLGTPSTRFPRFVSDRFSDITSAQALGYVRKLQTTVSHECDDVLEAAREVITTARLVWPELDRLLSE